MESCPACDAADFPVFCLDPFIGNLEPEQFLAFHRLVFKVFSRPHDFGFDSQDEAAEAFLRYKERIGTIIKRGSSISGKSEAYVDTCIRFIAKSLKRCARRKDIMEQVMETFALGSSLPQFCAEPEPPAVAEGQRSPRADYLASLGTDKRRQLYLTVKCAWELDDSLVFSIAERLGLPPAWLQELLHTAKMSVEAQMGVLERHKERKNALWVKICLAQARLSDPSLGPEECRRIEERLARYRRLYLAVLERINAKRLLVSNRDIAQILGVPKGSVDSGLYYLKTQDARRRSLPS